MFKESETIGIHKEKIMKHAMISMQDTAIEAINDQKTNQSLENVRINSNTYETMFPGQ